MSIRLKQQWQSWQQRFSEQPRDRRLLIAVALWVLLALPLLSYQVMPAVDNHQQQQQQIANAKEQIAQQQQLSSQLQQQLQMDVDQPLQQQIKRMQQRLESIKDTTDKFTLLDKSERRQFLERALAYPDSISLVNLNSDSPLAIGEERDYASLYQHQVTATYNGNFVELQLFFEQLRQQHPNVQWREFHYRVLEYPGAEVKISWLLLSVDKEIIGG